MRYLAVPFQARSTRSTSIQVEAPRDPSSAQPTGSGDRISSEFFLAGEPESRGSPSTENAPPRSLKELARPKRPGVRSRRKLSPQGRGRTVTTFGQGDVRPPDASELRQARSRRRGLREARSRGNPTGKVRPRRPGLPVDPPTGETRALIGAVYRNDFGTVFFELRNG